MRNDPQAVMLFAAGFGTRMGALTADRPYRAAMPMGQALDIMRGEVGQAVDPCVFEALERLIVNRPELMAA